VANENDQVLPEPAWWSWRRISGDQTAKLTLLISLLFLLIMSLYGVVFIIQDHRDMRKHTEARGLALARGVAAIGATAVLDNLFMVQSAITQIRGQNDIQRILVLDPDHMVVASDQIDRIGQTLEDEAIALAESRRVETVLMTRVGGEKEESLVVIEPLYFDPVSRTGIGTAAGLLGTSNSKSLGWIRIELSLDRVRKEALARLVEHLTFALVLLVVALVVVRKTVTRLSRHLLESEARLRLTIDTAMDAVITLDEQGVVTEWNAQAAAIFGWSEREAIGRLLTDLVIPSRLREVWGSEVALFRCTGDRPQTGKRIEVMALRRDCSEFPAELSVASILLNGHEGYSVFVRDTTDRRRAEEALINAKNIAEAASQAKTEFLANMSHEIRTPLNGIMGMTELLLETALSDKQHRFAEIVNRSGISLLDIVNDILDFSKIEAGKIQLDDGNIDLQELIGEVMDLLGHRAQAKHLELASCIHDGVPNHLRGDAIRLRQILVNLLGNALKFTETGEVVLSVSTVEEDANQVTLLVEVKDTGIGIDPSVHETIFEAFSQADGSTTRKFGGTGLGLTIVKQLVQLMEGSVGVESSLGAGSTFWCHIPFCKQLPVAPQQWEACAALQSMRVLVVDDNATNRQILDHYLDAWGIAHATASSATEALEMLRGRTGKAVAFDLAIIDGQMPDMDGFELARTIKSDKRLQMMKIIMLTSMGQYGPSLLPEQGADLVCSITKPVRQSHLYNRLIALTVPERLTPVSSDSVTPPIADLPPAQNVSVLVAEDNPVNRDVALAMLEALGYRVDTACNGREAVEAVATRRYHLVFMDCQMPEMDGFEATAAIRAREGELGLSRLPIIALTAHAIAGDRERCVAQGMDDYMSKPFTKQQLGAMIQRWVQGADGETETASDRSEAVAAERVQSRTALTGQGRRQTGSLSAPDPTLADHTLAQLRALRRPGRPDPVAKILTSFLESSARHVSVIQEAVIHQDAKALFQAAHALKSSSAMIGALALSDFVKDFEQMGRRDKVLHNQVKMAELDALYEAVRQAVHDELGKEAA
jgi:PAS domain S-box-containing protein